VTLVAPSMLFVPLPFVAAAFLAVLFASIVRRDEAQAGNRAFLTLIAACAVQSALMGLRWGYGVEAIRSVMPIVAAALPPLVYASFGSLTAPSTTHRPPIAWMHLVPACVVGSLVAFWRQPIDATLIAIDFGYAAALLWVARSGPDGLRHARLEVGLSAYRALQLAAAALVASALIDAFIAWDVAWTHGAHAAQVISVADLIGLFALGYAASVAGKSRPESEPVAAPQTTPLIDNQEDHAVLATIDDLMRTQKLFRDANLNLDRLARKAGMPARRISMAINQLTTRNVSQYVNDHRIAAACDLLKTTSLAVTTIMFDVGFQTKSNFNREFRRVTGTNPSDWRTQSGSVSGDEHRNADLSDCGTTPSRVS
jgi:AraC-like DNA-binding protein